MTSAALLVSGSVSDLDLGKVMEITSLGRQMVRLEVASSTGLLIGSVVLKAGRIVSATAGAQQGQSALKVILAADPTSRFRILRESQPVSSTSPIGLVDDVVGSVGFAARSSGRERAPANRVPILEGRLSEFDVATLINTLALGRQYAQLEVLGSDGAAIGSVVVKAGKVVRARAGQQDGVGAVRELLEAPNQSRFAVFRIDARLDPTVATDLPLGAVAQVMFEVQGQGAKVANKQSDPRANLVMEGLLSEFDVPTLLQTVGMGRQNLGLQVLQSGALLGTLYTKAGMLVSAQAGAAHGLAAVRQLLRSSPQCQFKVVRLAGESRAGEPIGSISKVLMTVMDSGSLPALASRAPTDRVPAPEGERVALMQGRVADIAVSTLFQVLTGTRQHTQIEFSSAGGALIGQVSLKAGMLVAAQAGEHTEVEAFLWLLSAPADCTFAVYRRRDAVRAKVPLGSVVELLSALKRTVPLVAVSVASETLAAGPTSEPRRSSRGPLWLGGIAAGAVIAFFVLRSPDQPAVTSPPANAPSAVTAVAPAAEPVARIENPAPVVPQVPPTVVAEATASPPAPVVEKAEPTPPPQSGAAAPSESRVAREPPVAKISTRRGQLLLKRLGYAVGPIDNIFGRLTKAAVSAFQKDEQLPGTGLLDPETSSALTSRSKTR